jgi:hypothetical protein
MPSSKLNESRHRDSLNVELWPRKAGVMRRTEKSAKRDISLQNHRPARIHSSASVVPWLIRDGRSAAICTELSADNPWPGNTLGAQIAEKMQSGLGLVDRPLCERSPHPGWPALESPTRKNLWAAASPTERNRSHDRKLTFHPALPGLTYRRSRRYALQSGAQRARCPQRPASTERVTIRRRRMHLVRQLTIWLAN